MRALEWLAQGRGPSGPIIDLCVASAKPLLVSTDMCRPVAVLGECEIVKNRPENSRDMDPFARRYVCVYIPSPMSSEIYRRERADCSMELEVACGWDD
jgi:hypothetical protein